MMRMKIISRVVTAACLAAAVAESASACGCEPLAAKESKKRSEVVFSGTVIDSHKELSPDGEEWRVRLKVENFWKGEPGEEVIVYTAGECMVRFGQGENHLVFAARQEGRGRLITDACRNSGPLELHSGEVEKLGKPKRRPPKETE